MVIAIVGLLYGGNFIGCFMAFALWVYFVGFALWIALLALLCGGWGRKVDVSSWELLKFLVLCDEDTSVPIHLMFGIIIYLDLG